MKRMLGVLLLGAMVILAGCGGSSSPHPVAGDGEKKPTKLKLASSSPLSGGAVSLGEAIKFGVQVALNERKADLRKAGYEIDFLPEDDEDKADVGIQLAAQLVNDPLVLAVVGTLNSGVAMAELPKYKDAKLVMVSPANTNADLTKSGYENYNRVCFTDDYQGPSGARFAAQVLKVKTAWVVNDQTPYGLGLANQFKAEAERQGIKILGTSDSSDKQVDFSAQLTPIAAANPELIYYGGLAQAGSNLIKQARDKLPNVKFMGGNGWDAPDLIKFAGKAAENTWLTSVDADLTTDAGKKFAEAYKKISADKDPIGYSAFGYDAAMVILNALIEYGTKNSGKAPSRGELAALVRATKGYKGLGGEVSFDAKGDNPMSKVYVFKVENGKQIRVGPAPRA